MIPSQPDSALPAHFDASRLTDMTKYNGLETVKDRAAYMFMVGDYMSYLRSKPWDWDDLWRDEEQQRLALCFVDAIQGDSWPIARQMVPEFQEPAADVEELREPLKTIFRAVAGRLQPPPPEPYDGQRWEEEMHWRRTRSQLEYIAFLGGSAVAASEERKQEVEDALDTLKTASEVVKSGDKTPGDTQKGGDKAGESKKVGEPKKAGGSKKAAGSKKAKEIPQVPSTVTPFTIAAHRRVEGDEAHQDAEVQDQDAVGQESVDEGGLYIRQRSARQRLGLSGREK